MQLLTSQVAACYSQPQLLLVGPIQAGVDDPQHLLVYQPGQQQQRVTNQRQPHRPTPAAGRTSDGSASKSAPLLRQKLGHGREPPGTSPHGSGSTGQIASAIADSTRSAAIARRAGETLRNTGWRAQFCCNRTGGSAHLTPHIQHSSRARQANPQDPTLMVLRTGNSSSPLTASRRCATPCMHRVQRYLQHACMPPAIKRPPASLPPNSQRPLIVSSARACMHAQGNRPPPHRHAATIRPAHTSQSHGTTSSVCMYTAPQPACCSVRVQAAGAGRAAGKRSYQHMTSTADPV